MNTKSSSQKYLLVLWVLALCDARLIQGASAIESVEKKL